MEYLFIDNPSLLSIIVAGVALFLAVFYFVHNRQALPPGPTGLPYLGIWPFLKENTCHLQMEEYSRRYGDVSSFTCMGRLFVNLGSTRAVREVHIARSEFFQDRAVDSIVLEDMYGNGLLQINGEAGRLQRKFFQQVMRERGVRAIAGTRQASVSDVIDSVIEELKGAGERPVDMFELVTRKCTSTLRLTLFGEEGLTDTEITDLCQIYEVMGAALTRTNSLLVGNFARYCILPFISNYRVAMKSTTKVNKILQGIVDEHKATYSEEHMRDIIDEFIRERNTRQKKGDPTAEYFDDRALLGNLTQFIGDGVMAVSLFVSIMVKSLVEHPEEQEKIHEEIIGVVGPDRQPTMDDKPNLPYLNAFILEVLRTSNFITMFLGLECTKETTLRGYKIPRGAITMVNVWSAHNDRETYEEPGKFDPSRFLSRDDKKRPDLPIVFGVGKRSCLGEGFAMMQIFLFLSAIVKNFKLSMLNNTDTPIFELLVSGKLKIKAQQRT